jgi:hypothetical protein
MKEGKRGGARRAGEERGRSLGSGGFLGLFIIPIFGRMLFIIILI